MIDQGQLQVRLKTDDSPVLHLNREDAALIIDACGLVSLIKSIFRKTSRPNVTRVGTGTAWFFFWTV